ncbi:MAG: CinA family protein [Endozoicomonas sp.]
MDAELTNLARLLAEKLQKTGLRLATAESCTGGWISQVLTAISGSSVWFEGGIVSYSNGMKCNLLGVSPETISTQGAVSQEVVEEMAQGVASRLRVPLSVSVSGIAGPGGGTEDKPVGTVWIGWCFDSRVSSGAYRFEGNREQVRRQTVAVALEGLIQRLESLER